MMGERKSSLNSPGLLYLTSCSTSSRLLGEGRIHMLVKIFSLFGVLHNL